jgi:hypothetical protein
MNFLVSDINQTTPEKQSISDLFSGSIGAYKNPQSHREVNIQDPKIAAEIIILANHLYRIVDMKNTVTK